MGYCLRLNKIVAANYRMSNVSTRLQRHAAVFANNPTCHFELFVLILVAQVSFTSGQHAVSRYLAQLRFKKTPQAPISCSKAELASRGVENEEWWTSCQTTIKNVRVVRGSHGALLMCCCSGLQRKETNSGAALCCRNGSIAHCVNLGNLLRTQILARCLVLQDGASALHACARHLASSSFSCSCNARSCWPAWQCGPICVQCRNSFGASKPGTRCVTR